MRRSLSSTVETSLPSIDTPNFVVTKSAYCDTEVRDRSLSIVWCRATDSAHCETELNGSTDNKDRSLEHLDASANLNPKP